MDVYRILVELLDKPNAPKFYRNLYNFYKLKNMENEAEAFLYLIENKFDKNDTDN